MSIRDELLETVGIKPKKNEADPALIKRLVGKAEALNDGEGLDDENWEKLSTEAQEFYNLVITAGKNHADGKVLDLADGDVPLFPDENGTEDPEPEPQPEEAGEGASEEPEDVENDPEEEEEVMETKTKKVAAKKTVAKKVATKKVAAKKNGSGEKAISMRHRLKQLVIKKPTFGVDDLVAKLKDEGFKATKMTVGSIRADTRHTMKVLVEAGLLEVEL